MVYFKIHHIYPPYTPLSNVLIPNGFPFMNLSPIKHYYLYINEEGLIRITQVCHPVSDESLFISLLAHCQPHEAKWLRSSKSSQLEALNDFINTGSDFLTSKQMNSLRALRFSSLREKVKSRTRPSFSLIDI